MTLSLNPKHLQRYKDVAALALKYRGLEVQPDADASPSAARGNEDSKGAADPKPAELAADPFYNPNLALSENLFTLASPPRTELRLWTKS